VARPPGPGARARYSPEVDFTANEAAYLAQQRLGRLATIGHNGAPHNVPVAFHFNPALGTIDIGGHALGKTRKFHDVQREPRVSFVVDDLASIDPWVAHGIEIRGKAEALSYGGESLGPGFGPELIRIYPTRIIAWALDGPPMSGANARNVSH
jgi:PPOX class F420-dependent enzyme/OxyR family protein